MGDGVMGGGGCLYLFVCERLIDERRGGGGALDWMRLLSRMG